MNLDVGDRRHRQVLLQRLEIPAGIERHEHAELRSRIQQSRHLRILPNHAGGEVNRQSVASIGQQGPRLAVVVRAIDVGLEVVLAQEPIGRDVGAAALMRRVLDGLNPRADQARRRHALPRLAAVARHADRPVIRANPQDAPFQSRLDHRVDRRVHLFTRHVACDRRAGRVWYSGSFAVRSGLMTSQDIPSFIERWITWEA